MNNYTCNHDDIGVEDCCCINHFLDSVIEEVFDTDSDFSSTTIVASGELAQDLIRLLLSTTMEDDDDFVFHMGMVDFDSIEYDQEYYISINTDHEVWCCPSYQDDEYGKGYLIDGADHTYIFEDCNYKILDKIESDVVTIFGFEDED